MLWMLGYVAFVCWMCSYFIGSDSGYRDADGSIEYMRLLHVIRMDVTFHTRASNASGQESGYEIISSRFSGLGVSC